MLRQIRHPREHCSAFYHCNPKETASDFQDEFLHRQLPAAGLCEALSARLTDLSSATFLPLSVQILADVG